VAAHVCNLAACGTAMHYISAAAYFCKRQLAIIPPSTIVLTCFSCIHIQPFFHLPPLGQTQHTRWNCRATRWFGTWWTLMLSWPDWVWEWVVHADQLFIHAVCTVYFDYFTSFTLASCVMAGVVLCCFVLFVAGLSALTYYTPYLLCLVWSCSARQTVVLLMPCIRVGIFF
jgi:hypothetical protein